MSDTLMTIIGIFIAVVLMFIFPLMELSGKNDEIAQTVAQVAVSDFVNKVASQGKITELDYNELTQKLNSTGNSFDIQIEIQVIDDNPRRATTTGYREILGEYKYYSIYTNTILEEIEKKIENDDEGEYELKKDDYIIVTVKNKNITLGMQLKNFMYNIVRGDSSVIEASASSVVLNSANNKVEKMEIATAPSPSVPTPNPPAAPVIPEIVLNKVTWKKEEIINNTDIIFILDDSGSMENEWDEVESACKNISTWIFDDNKAENTYIGFVRYGKTSATQLGSITSKAEINSTISNLENNYGGRPYDGTNFNLGFGIAGNVIQEDLINQGRTNQRIVIFLADGSDDEFEVNKITQFRDMYNVNRFYGIFFDATSTQILPIEKTNAKNQILNIVETFGSNGATAQKLETNGNNLTGTFKDILKQLRTTKDVQGGTTFGSVKINGYIELTGAQVSAERKLKIVVKQNETVIGNVEVTNLPTSSEGFYIVEGGNVKISVQALLNSYGLTSFDNITVQVEYFES